MTNFQRIEGSCMADETSVQIESTSNDATSEDYTGLTDAVSELVKVMRSGDLERLEVKQGELHILLCARSAAPPVPQSSEPPAAAPNAAPQPAQIAAEAESQPWHQITSPMVGTFYESPSPGEPPFVQPGDRVEVGQTVAIIEAMKIMNEIVADRSGVIEAILAEDGEAVEFGHPLFRMKPA
jgi:acetyl-CoA carboxylase biotin carboxyl carrier protein